MCLHTSLVILKIIYLRGKLSKLILETWKQDIVKTWHFYNMWKYVESSIRKSSIRKFSAPLLSIKKFSRVEKGLWSEQSYSKLVFQIFYHHSKEVNKTIFSKFFFPDHFSVVSGGNKWSKNWRKSCCKQIKVTKVTYCVQSQQCPFWTLFDIFAPQILQICMMFRGFNYWICQNNNKAKSLEKLHILFDLAKEVFRELNEFRIKYAHFFMSIPFMSIIRLKTAVLVSII